MHLKMSIRDAKREISHRIIHALVALMHGDGSVHCLLSIVTKGLHLNTSFLTLDCKEKRLLSVSTEIITSDPNYTHTSIVNFFKIGTFKTNHTLNHLALTSLKTLGFINSLLVGTV